MELKNKKIGEKLAEIKRKGKAIVLAGLVLAGSAANVANVKATVPATDDPEVSFMELVNRYEVSDASFVKQHRTQLLDIRDEGQKRARAGEILENIKALGLKDFTEQEVLNMLNILGGQNPFDRPLEVEDAAFVVNRLYTIMNQESVVNAKKLREITGQELNDKMFDYTLFVVDNHLTNNIIGVMQHYRHGILLNPSKEQAYPYGQALTKYLVHTFLLNGYLDYPSFHETETAGERMLTISLALNSAELVEAIGLGVMYQFHEIVEGKDHYCVWTIGQIEEAINILECYDPTTGKLMNPQSAALLGMLYDANYGSKDPEYRK